MDFFANAFITRDVPAQADEESDVVTKDGIQIREKAMAQPSGTDIVKCEVCGVVNAKYKCPGCFCQTCSLKCSKQHKLDTTCSGVRSRTHFVERKQYSEQDMMSDYNFLEEVGRTVDNAARDNIKLDHGNNPNRKKIFGANGSVINLQGQHNKNRNQNKHNTAAPSANDASEAISLTAAQELERLGSVGSGSYKDKQLILQAKKRASHLIMMADGLKKRKENSTHWKDKPSRILWTLEWLFPEYNSPSSDSLKPRRILAHKNEESKVLKDLLAEQLAKEENTDVAKYHPVDTLDQCRLFFVIPLRHANKPALYPLRSQDTIQEALKFKKVLEYPTIMVLGPQSTSSSTPATSETTKETENKESGDTIANPGVTTIQEGGDEYKDDPILARYTIESPPIHWPKKAMPAKNDTKRPNEVEEEEDQPKAKKAKTEMEGDDDEESSSEESSDDSSDESSDDSSDDDDDSDEEEEGVDKKEIKNEGDDSMDSSETPGVTEEDQESQLKLGQAILEAFNQDFGQEAQQ
ncbi:hypothetical protein BGZ93_001976 [Podila epicladia]|nr:hypothetical protein BGZ92_009013 [Podila epicladia]KAG0097779.1 hypothetical protein BGZ93_001976 [Podila epicladia]